MRRLILWVVVAVGFVAAAAACGSSGGAKPKESSVDCSYPQITSYEGTLLTLRQVEDAFAAQGMRLGPIVPKEPLLGLQVRSLPNGAAVGVVLATKCNEGVPSFAYFHAVGAPPPKVSRVVVQNVGIEYQDLQPKTLRRIKAVVASLKRLVRSLNAH